MLNPRAFSKAGFSGSIVKHNLLNAARSFRHSCKLLGSALIGTLLLAALTLAGDWTTYAHDPQRSGWAFDEKTLSPGNVSDLGLQWKTRLNNRSFSLSALTIPVVATGVPTTDGIRSVVYVAGITGTVFAVDAQTGQQLWTRTLRSMVTARAGGLQGTFLCPNGITATPVIDKVTNILYVIAPDGQLYGLDLGSGRVRYGPVQFVSPFAKTWSINLVDGTVYTTVSNGCGNGRSGVYAIDVRDPLHPSVREILLSKAFTAGIWGRGGVTIGENGTIYGGTADGDTNPKEGDYSSTVVGISLKNLSVVDYFLPSNWPYLKKKDFDVGSSSPIWFMWKNRPLVAHGFKEGVVYLMDANQLGGKDHASPLFKTSRLGNDRELCCEGSGIWGALSTSRDGVGQTWIYVPVGGPPAASGPKFPEVNGENPHGSIMAFKVVTDPKTQQPMLGPAWISGDFDLPDPVVIANGVVFGLSNGENADQRLLESTRLLGKHPAVLKALDAKTGRELYNSGNSMTSWVHFSGLAVADGRVYAVDHDSTVYCFGLGGTAKGNSAPGSNVSKLAGGEGVRDELSTSWIGRAARQDEYLRSWIKRAGLALALALLAAVVGVWAGVRTEAL